MPDAAVVPTWLVIVLTIGTPVLTFVGVVAGNRVTRRGDVELETRSKREETMRTLRWAAELSLSDDPARADLGLRELQALDEAEMLDEEQQVFVSAALEAVVAEPEEVIEAATEAGFEVEVVVQDVAGVSVDPGTVVSWESQTDQSEGEHD